MFLNKLVTNLVTKRSFKTHILYIFSILNGDRRCPVGPVVQWLRHFLDMEVIAVRFCAGPFLLIKFKKLNFLIRL